MKHKDSRDAISQLLARLKFVWQRLPPTAAGSAPDQSYDESQHSKEMQMPNWAIDGLLELHAINKAGYAAEISNVTRDITGKDSIGFEQFAKDNAARF